MRNTVIEKQELSHYLLHFTESVKGEEDHKYRMSSEYYMIQKFLKIICIPSSISVKNSGGKEGHKANVKSMEDSCQYTE